MLPTPSKLEYTFQEVFVGSKVHFELKLNNVSRECLLKLRHLYKSPKVLLDFQTMALNLTLHKYVVKHIAFLKNIKAYFNHC